MELRHLRYFVTLAEELHFGRTAKRLYISQPPLSRQIKDLENELGVTLFLRDNKRVELTAAGRFFYQEVQTLLQRLQLAQEHVNLLHQSLSGEVKIGYISSIDKTKLGQLLHLLQEIYPFLQTKLYELPSERQVTALKNNKMDIGIIRAPNYAAQLQTEKLYADGFALAYPADWKLPNEREQLGALPFISYHADYAPIYHSQMLAYCAHVGFTPMLRHECNNIASILELVHLHTGIAVVPKSVQSQYNHLAINFLNLDESAIQTDILLAYMKDQQHPAFSVLHQLIINIFKQ
ncbi:LysR family transcriptional regulator [Sphingobacterium suaedae]|uniref:LysR family transcriptional regulator n=1 Tax=Sphingobacterium suaedae TaxID=1686402 RepID=A0ABW5KEI6_9SPHI